MNGWLQGKLSMSRWLRIRMPVSLDRRLAVLMRGLMPGSRNRPRLHDLHLRDFRLDHELIAALRALGGAAAALDRGLHGQPTLGATEFNLHEWRRIEG